MHIRLDPSPRWPYSMAQLRADEPQLSLSAVPHDAELAALAELGILVARIEPTPRPEDTREQRAEESFPVQDGTVWRQAWTLRDATGAELVAWDAAHAPAPDWARFKAAILSNTAINAALAQALPLAPAAATALAPTLLQCEQGQTVDFAAAWAAVLAVAPVAPEVLADLVALAADCHLSAEFVAALTPAAT